MILFDDATFPDLRKTSSDILRGRAVLGDLGDDISGLDPLTPLLDDHVGAARDLVAVELAGIGADQHCRAERAELGRRHNDHLGVSSLVEHAPVGLVLDEVIHLLNHSGSLRDDRLAERVERDDGLVSRNYLALVHGELGASRYRILSRGRHDEHTVTGIGRKMIQPSVILGHHGLAAPLVDRIALRDRLSILDKELIVQPCNLLIHLRYGDVSLPREKLLAAAVSYHEALQAADDDSAAMIPTASPISTERLVARLRP